MAVSLDYIKEVMREQDLKYFCIRDSEYRMQYEQFQPISIEESIRRLDNFFNHAKDSIYHVFVYKLNTLKADGTPKTQPYEYEIMLTNSIKGNENVQISGTMNGFGGSGAQGVPLDNFLSSKDEIMTLKLKVMELEMKMQNMQSMHDREMDRIKQDHEKAMSSESRIQGIVGQIAPMFGFGGGAGINGVSGLAGVDTAELNEVINKLSTENTMDTQKERVIKAVNTLLQLDTNFAENLEKLANLAKTKPEVYKQAVNILKSM
jgi:hypothetical protein